MQQHTQLIEDSAGQNDGVNNKNQDIQARVGGTPESVKRIYSLTQQLLNFPKLHIQQLRENILQDDDKLQKINDSLDDLFEKISRLNSEVESAKESTITQFQPQSLYKSMPNLDHYQVKLPATNIKTQKDLSQIKINEQISQKNMGLSMRHFQLGRKIGQGKFGEIFQCLHLNTKSIYALKKIFKSTISEYHMESQLAQEIQIMRSLNHSNIVQLYESFQDEYHIFLLMEYIHGKSLEKYFNSPEKFISQIIFQILNALDYIHSMYIVHRDLKPENVLYHNGVIKLCDFGWATSFESPKINILCGTTDYISPEVLQEATCNQSIDLWCVGILTYQLLCGKVPYKQKEKKQHFENILNCDLITINYPETISIECKSFIEGFLKKNPKQRMSIKDSLNHDFIKKYRQIQVRQQINEQMIRLYEQC